MLYPYVLQTQVLGNTVEHWFMAVMIFIVLMLAARVFRGVVVSYLLPVAQKTSSKVDDTFMRALENIGMWFYAVTFLFVATRILVLPSFLDKCIYGLFVLALLYEVIRFGERIILFMVEAVWLKEEEKAQREHLSEVIGFLVKLFLWSLGFLFILSNLGINVTSLLTSLGIGGIAIALAIQNILSDMFSSFSIYFDQPFKVGDFIIVGGHEGTVKKIGLKTTRIKALRGEEVVISNSELTSAHVQNFKRLRKRRVAFMIGVMYGTPSAKLKKIPEIVQSVVEGVEGTELGRVHFKEFGDFSLNYEIVFHALTNVYKEYMDAREQINLGLVDAFAKEGIEFAFPTQTVHVVK